MKKSVALVHFAYPPHIGGVELLLKEHAVILENLGYHVTVLTGSGSLELPNVTLHEVPEFQSLLNYDKKLQDKILDKGIVDEDFYNMSKKLYKIMEERFAKQDTIIIHNMLTIPRNLPFVHAFKKYATDHPEKNIIAWTHDHFYILEEKIRNIKELASSDFEVELLTTPVPNAQYVVISKTFKNILLQVVDIPDDNVHVVPNGIHIKRLLEMDDSIWKMISKQKLLDAFPLVLSPVNILPRKNIEYSLNTIHELKKQYPHIRYLITGMPSRHRDTKEYMNKIHQQIEDLKLKTNVLFLSNYFDRFVKDSELHDLYSISDLVFYFSNSENFGIPILEAAATKTPIFVSNLAVFHEIGAGQLNYVDTKKQSPEQTAKAVDTFLQNSPGITINRITRTQYNLETILKNKLVPLLEK